MMLGAALVVTTLIGAETALGFVFDPRYRDFPFASLTMAVVPFAGLMLLNRPQGGVRPVAEGVFAALLAASALYTLFNEGSDNWQSLWTCAVYLLFAVTLWQARAVQTPK
jgi:glucan 1,3-beta-glucosidase